MKKSIIFVAALVIGALMFSSCQKDGQYKPKKKIARIEHKATYTLGSATLTAVNESEEWEWTGKQLTKITYYDGNDAIYGYMIPKYDSKKRVESFHSVLGSSVKDYVFSYDGKDLVKISCYTDDGKLDSEYKFIKEGKNVVEIALEEFSSKASVEGNINPLQYILPREVAENIKPVDGKSTMTYKLTWDGKNVVSLDTYADENLFMERKFSYDAAVNPMKGLFTNDGITSMNELYSANNIVASTSTSTYVNDNMTLNVEEEYTYEYTDNYPVKKTWETTTSLGTELSHVMTYTYQE